MYYEISELAVSFFYSFIEFIFICINDYFKYNLELTILSLFFCIELAYDTIRIQMVENSKSGDDFGMEL